MRACATRVPLATGAADAVVSSMALMVVAADAVLAEAARLLRPGGTFVATVPIRSTGAEFAEILDVLGQRRTAYPGSLDGNGISSAGLTVLADDTRLFRRRVSGGDDAATVVRSFYAPGTDGGGKAAAVAMLQRRVRAGPVVVPYRIRRLVAVR